jgi:DNA polymerase IV
MTMRDEYVIHIDGDSFFVAVELTRRPDLWGKPVITGGERGIASAMSREAKSLGITRAMPVFKIKKEFPQVVILPSDFTLYEMYSDRMSKIVARYTDEVERYSIDECFARVRATDVEIESILRHIQRDVDIELGISVSLGAAINKTIAKLASSKSKPHGCKVVYIGDERSFVSDISASLVWGVGRATQKMLSMYKLYTVSDILQKPYEWYASRFSKPFLETYVELSGVRVFKVSGYHEPHKSIAKTRSFPTFLTEYSDVFSELSRNVELACMRLRKESLATTHVSFFVRTKEFGYFSDSFVLASPTTQAPIIIVQIEQRLKLIWRKDVYRSSGVTFYGLVPTDVEQLSLFEAPKSAQSMDIVQNDVDLLIKDISSMGIMLGSSVVSHHRYRDAYKASRKDERLQTVLEAFRIHKYICLPYMGRVV